jgi:hypothetical protein
MCCAAQRGPNNRPEPMIDAMVPNTGPPSPVRLRMPSAPAER